MKRVSVNGCVVILLLFGCGQTRTAPEGMALVAAGEFIMGSAKEDTEKKSIEFGMVKPLYQDEKPEHKVYLKAYFVDRHEVTNGQYKKFVEATGSRPPEHWENGVVPLEREMYPVINVNWYDASRYCQWLGKRLPTEAEWEKAARGTDGREYPWGNEWDAQKANSGETGIGDLTPVGKFENGKSPYGVYDMAGNVWEWTADWYKPYEGSTYMSDAFGEKYKVVRGSSWGGMGHYAIPAFYRTSYRFYVPPEGAFPDAGFRCVMDAR
jgi:formylglycine-generating enzyme required for sulfatase activity